MPAYESSSEGQAGFIVLDEQHRAKGPQVDKVGALPLSSNVMTVLLTRPISNQMSRCCLEEVSHPRDVTTAYVRFSTKVIAFEIPPKESGYKVEDSFLIKQFDLPEKTRWILVDQETIGSIAAAALMRPGRSYFLYVQDLISDPLQLVMPFASEFGRFSVVYSTSLRKVGKRTLLDATFQVSSLPSNPETCQTTLAFFIEIVSPISNVVDDDTSRYMPPAFFANNKLGMELVEEKDMEAKGKLKFTGNVSFNVTVPFLGSIEAAIGGEKEFEIKDSKQTTQKSNNSLTKLGATLKFNGERKEAVVVSPVTIDVSGLDTSITNDFALRLTVGTTTDNKGQQLISSSRIIHFDLAPLVYPSADWHLPAGDPLSRYCLANQIHMSHLENSEREPKCPDNVTSDPLNQEAFPRIQFNGDEKRLACEIGGNDMLRAFWLQNSTKWCLVSHDNKSMLLETKHMEAPKVYSLCVQSLISEPQQVPVLQTDSDAPVRYSAICSTRLRKESDKTMLDVIVQVTSGVKRPGDYAQSSLECEVHVVEEDVQSNKCHSVFTDDKLDMERVKEGEWETQLGNHRMLCLRRLSMDISKPFSKMLERPVPRPQKCPHPSKMACGKMASGAFGLSGWPMKPQLCMVFTTTMDVSNVLPSGAVKLKLDVSSSGKYVSSKGKAADLSGSAEIILQVVPFKSLAGESSPDPPKEFLTSRCIVVVSEKQTGG